MTQQATITKQYIPETPISIDELAEEIKAAHALAQDGVRSSLKLAFRVGELLVQARSLIRHGGWLQFLEQKCDVGQRSAQRYIRLYRRFGSNPTRVSHLSLREALKLLADVPSADEIDADEATQGLIDENSAPEPPVRPVTVTGDLWRCGEHRLLCGDSTHMSDIERALGGGQADMGFNDPPYSASYIGKTSRKLTMKNDDLGAGFADFLRAVCTNALAATKGAIYICMSSSEIDTLLRKLSPMPEAIGPRS